MISRSELLRLLPPVKGKATLVEDDQDVHDIVREILDAHGEFEDDYRRIADKFAADSMDSCAEKIFKFLKANVKYRIESGQYQSTRSPGVILASANGDCKHYASFIGGVLGALGYTDWVYRFASYSLLNPDPGHVFIVLHPGSDREVWVDPVLSGYDVRNPRYYHKIDKKIKAGKMALHRIEGIGQSDQYYPDNFYNPVIHGYVGLVLGGAYYGTPVRFFVDGELFTMPTVPAYQLAREGKPVPLVPIGLTVKYNPTNFLGKKMPDEMLYPIITQDRKMLVQSNYGTMYDFKDKPAGLTNEILIADDNRLLKLLAISLGVIQMAYQPSPDAERLQRHYERILNNRNTNFMEPKEIKTFAGSVIQGIADAVKAVGEGFLKFAGAPLRTAFLQLIRLNAFNMAGNLWKHMQTANGASEAKKKWEGFGGEYNMLVNAARDGSAKKALLSGAEIGEAISVSALLAAAAPVIALLKKLLTPIVGEDAANNVVDWASRQMEDILNGTKESPAGMADAMGGKPIIVPNGGSYENGSIIIPSDRGGVMTWINDNPFAAAAVAGGAVIFMMRAKKFYTR